ncbi:MAG: EAL domain-containing protein [Azoarcus sp.]|nr:EAL domain-containing protein [Azoarcus sp.]
MIRCIARARRTLAQLPCILAAVAMLLLAGTSSADDTRELRVGVYENPPKVFSNAQGQPTGSLVELLREIAEIEGWRLIFVRCQWQACLEQLEDGRLDLLPDVAYTAERSKRFDFHQIPALHSWSQVYRRTDVAIESVLDLSGKRIAMLAGGVQQQALHDMLTGFNIQFDMVLTSSPEEAFRLAAAGEADAAIASYQFGAFKAAEFRLVDTPIVFLPSRLFYATASGRNADLRARIDAHLKPWQQDPESPYFSILKRWGGHEPDTLVPPALRNALLILVALGLALSAGVLLLRRQVKSRTRELVAVNRQLAATLDAIPDLLFEIDLNGRYIDVRAVRPEQLAAPAASVVGKTIPEVLPGKAAAVCMEALREANEAGWSSGRQIELPLAQGTMWFELSVARKLSAPDTVPRFIVLSRDVTDRHLAELRVQRLSGLYATLSQCNQAIVRSTDQNDLLHQICHAIVRFGGMKMAWIGLIDERDGLVKPVAVCCDITANLEGIAIWAHADEPFGGGPTGTAIHNDSPFWCQDFANDPATAPWHELGKRFDLGALAALPLHREGSVIGTLTLYSSEINAFDTAAKDLLVEMAMDIDFALDRFRQDAERARMAEALVEREEKYRELTETINDVIWTLDPETLRFLYVSPSVFRLRGYTADEIMAQPMDAALTPESAMRVHQILTTHLAEFRAHKRSSRDFTIEEVEQPCKDGSTVWTEVVTNMVRNRKTGKVEVRGVTRDISERKRAEAQIQYLAHFDQLTGLPNRTLLKDRFDNALSLARRHGEPLAVMFLDLDHFKDINDTLGHEVGDQLLVEVGRRIEAALRVGDTVCRLGGDEFIFVLPETNADGASHVASKLLDTVSRPYLVGQHELNTTPSIGIAMFPEDGSDMDTLSRNADAAMYKVKREGRNAHCFYTREMQAYSVRALMVANALRHALDRGQLALHYQPQISLHDGRVIGAEALLRWQHPELGAISPGEFIPIAESNGLIIQIGEWVLRQAVAQAQRWTESGLPALVMAVNLSAVQFRHPNLPELVTRIVDEIGLPAERLELELTEAVAMNDPQLAITVMDKLFERGVHMSIDDFGTGYSSLSYLKRFKVNKLKIDQSFVRDITVDADDKAIVIAIINLARSLGMRTIAEGVETAGQLDFLRQQGCDEVQGYHFSRPLPAEAFETRVRELMAEAQSAGSALTSTSQRTTSEIIL